VNAVLRRDQVTKASEIMLPVYAIFCAYQAIVWGRLTPEEIESNIGLQYADDWMPAILWSACFAVAAISQGVALLLHRMETYMFGLCLQAVLFAVLGIVLAKGVFDTSVTYSAPAWPFFAVVCTFATIRSLRHQERQ